MPIERAAKAPVLRFFLLSHGWSWAFWTAAAAWGADVWDSGAKWLVFAGGVGPLLAGVYWTWRTTGGEGLRDLGLRLVAPRLIVEGGALVEWSRAMLTAAAAAGIVAAHGVRRFSDVECGGADG
jgi:uncharacterized protein